MNTARDVVCYAEQHDIHLIAENGDLILDAPKEALTDEFLKSAKTHKAELLETLSQPENLIEAACRGLEISPVQFRAICSEKVLQDISNESTPIEELRDYAESFADGIHAGRIVVHPKTQELIRHITADWWHWGVTE